MTIPATASQVPYAGDGVTVAFPITFIFDTAADIKVILTSAAGLPTVLSTGFAITGGNGSTGTCTMVTPPAVNEVLTVLDDPERSQTAEYPDNDSFPASAHENALDRVTRLVKRLHQRVERSIRVDDGDLSDGDDLITPISSARAGLFLAFDVDGNPIVSAGTGGGDAALRTDLASTVSGNDGSRRIGYRRTETGSVARSVYAALSERCLSVKDFGAQGDDATNDYVAITAAIAAAVASNALLVFPPGTYRHGTALAFGFSGLRVLGLGKVTLKYTGAGSNCVTIDGGVGTILYGHEFDGFTIEGSGSANQDGLYVRNHVHRITRNIRVRNVTRKAYVIEGDVLSIYENIYCSDNEGAFSSIPNFGMYIDGSASISSATACVFRNLVIECANDTGLYLNKADNNTFDLGSSEGLIGTTGNQGLGIYSTANSKGNLFQEFFCEANLTGGDLVEFGARNTYDNCTFNSLKATPPYEDVKSFIVKSGAEQINFKACQFYWGQIDSGAKFVRMLSSNGQNVTNNSVVGDNCTIEDTRLQFNSSSIIAGPLQGSFTPIFGGSTGDGTITHGAQLGGYIIKDGFCEGWLSVTATTVTGAPTGNLLIKGLPIVAKAGTQYPASVGNLNGITLPASRVQITAEVQGGAANIRLLGLASGLAASSVAGSGLASGAVISAWFKYPVA